MVRKVYLHADEEVVRKDVHHLLRRKADAHDAVMRAWAVLAVVQHEHLMGRQFGSTSERTYQLGWLDCFSAMADAIASASAAIRDEPRDEPAALDGLDDLPF